MSYIDLTFQTRISKIRSFSCVKVITQLHISELKEIAFSISTSVSKHVQKCRLIRKRLENGVVSENDYNCKHDSFVSSRCNCS